MDINFTYKEKPSDSKFVEAIWETEDKKDGLYLSPADGCWDIIFTSNESGNRILVSGPSSKVSNVYYKKGNHNFGIRFKPGAFITHPSAAKMRDLTIPLTILSKNYFWFNGRSWEIPNFENVESFIKKLTKHKIIKSDPIVELQINGHIPDITLRSVQRHFMHSIGISPHYMSQIVRCHKAVSLLKQGLPILDVVHELNYADQPHMTRVLKHLTGRTPAQIVRQNELFARVAFVQS